MCSSRFLTLPGQTKDGHLCMNMYINIPQLIFFAVELQHFANQRQSFVHSNKRKAQRFKMCSSKLKFNRKYPRFILRVCCFFIISLCCETESQRNQNETKKKLVFPPCEFKCYISFEVSTPAPHTQSHTLLMGNLNATSPGLHYCLKYRRVREWLFKPQNYLQLFVSSLGQFSSQSVQALFDGAIH